MDNLVKRAMATINNSFSIYKRYIDDTFLMTTNRDEATHILKHLNNQHPNIIFEIEHPDNQNSISLLDFKLQVNKSGKIETEFYQKQAKIDILPNYKSAIPLNSKINIIRNEIKRRKEKCSDPEKTTKHLNIFKETLNRNGYKIVISA